MMVYFLQKNQISWGASIRIFIVPRSLYRDLNVHPWEESVNFNKSGGYHFLDNLRPSNPHAWIKRINLCFGYSQAKFKTEKNFLTDIADKYRTKEDTKKFILTGFSYELNFAVLLNVGYAFAVTGRFRDSRAYWGVTMDSNLFKQLGLLP